MGLMEDARIFAERRDEQFDRISKEASKQIKEAFDMKSFLKSPEAYLSMLYVKIGTKVIKENMEEAREIGRKHAKRFLKI